MDEVNRHLLEIVRRYGTPTYAFDVQRLREQVEKLRTHLPAGVEILYSLKANASLGICDVLSSYGIGADVASAGELATAVEAGFPSRRIFVAGPFKLPETLAQLRELPEAVISVDSPSELHMLAEHHLPNPIVLRLRPDFGSQAIVAAGHESRFGFVGEDVSACRKLVNSRAVNVIGFHVFSGSQYLNAEGIVAHLRGALAISLRAAEELGTAPALLNLGGGFGIPYAATADELDLGIIGKELAMIAKRVPTTRIVLELGRYLVAQAGWYLTSVLGHQTFQGRPAVVVDGGTHQRADMCGLCLRTKARPPVALDAPMSELTPTDVLGCLSLPADVLCESSLLPRLDPGHVLAFANAGAYGLWSSPAMFHGSPLPAEVAFDGSEIQLMRERRSARSILDDQRHVNVRGHDA
ncbi:MAG: alanine racemase [Planctomycetaceae bacterium]|nr:alanine racemase [Planctomycetaceae bacterium]